MITADRARQSSSNNVMCCTIRSYEVIIRSDDSERGTCTVLMNRIYNV